MSTTASASPPRSRTTRATLIPAAARIELLGRGAHLAGMDDGVGLARKIDGRIKRDSDDAGGHLPDFIAGLCEGVSDPRRADD